MSNNAANNFTKNRKNTGLGHPAASRYSARSLKSTGRLKWAEHKIPETGRLKWAEGWSQNQQKSVENHRKPLCFC